VASRALRLLAEWALAKAGLARVQLYARVDNPASQRTAERAGFQREGVIRSHMLIKGERYDAVIFGLTAEDVASAS
jgi:RimJ/RimL family protein N-acetyltransferase